MMQAAVWRELAGQERVVRLLRGALERDRLAHAYLFYGPEGAGKGAAARILAMAVNCSAGGAGPCRACYSCRKIEADVHPDVQRVDPLRGAVGIDQVRRVIRECWRKPVEGRRRTFIFPQAHLITVPAANSLLKVLEEPPAASLFVLLSTNPFALPPTVVSRCQRVPFGRRAEAALAAVLAERGMEGHARLLAALSGGSLERALELAGSSLASCREQAVSLLELIGRGRGGSPGAEETRFFFRLAELMAGSAEDAGLFLDVLLTLCRDLLVWQARGEAGLLYNGNALRRLAEAGAGAWPCGGIQAGMAAVGAARRAIAQQANIRLCLESLFVRLWYALPGDCGDGP